MDDAIAYIEQPENAGFGERIAEKFKYTYYTGGSSESTGIRVEYFQDDIFIVSIEILK